MSKLIDQNPAAWQYHGIWGLFFSQITVVNIVDCI